MNQDQTKKDTRFLQRLGSTVRQARRSQGMTLKQFSQKVGYGKSMVSQVENGLNGISVEALRRIKDVLGIKWDDLLGNDKAQRCPRCKGQGFI
jgi:transcriptional regulator with XRE-family HTH domain